MIPSIEIRNTRSGLCGKNSTPTKTRGRLGMSTSHRINDAKIKAMSAQEPNDWKNLRSSLGSRSSLWKCIHMPSQRIESIQRIKRDFRSFLIIVG